MGFARLTDRIGKAILRGTYRTSAAVWELGEEVEEPEVSIIAPYLEEEQQRPYFELLVVREGSGKTPSAAFGRICAELAARRIPSSTSRSWSRRSRTP